MKYTEEELEIIMQCGIKEALELAKENGITFDFSHESVKDVEKLLEEFHHDYKKLKNEEEAFHGLSMILAAYIAEVLTRRGVKGKWIPTTRFGQDTIAFKVPGADLMLYHWCLKRIFDGKQDDVWLKYQNVVRALKL